MVISYNLAISLAILGSILGALASFNLKKSVSSKRFELTSLISKTFFLSLLFYGTASIINVIALMGAPYIVVFPITSTTWVWSLILSRLFLEEKLNKYKIFGVFLIFLGVILLI
ncbi:MAG: EamA family transporter [Candidatus Woesearchaeota archaeon]